MGAIRRSRVPGAAKLMTGAFLVALPVVGVVIGSDSAFASGTPTRQPAPAVATVANHSLRKPRITSTAAISRFVVKRGAIARPSGSTVVLHGLLLPRTSRAEVRLVARDGRGWRTLASARTRHSGRFGIRYRVRGVGATPVRVRYAGGRGRRAASAPAGKIVGLQPTVASWYDDGGNTACGFHATYGVANKTLPCGTKVTLSYGGHTVVATVDDRGPYVYGRSFDLNQNTARYLGMWGVAQVFASD
jgi:3D (Asp-Asp-Asp) domain-containing protein